MLGIRRRNSKPCKKPEADEIVILCGDVAPEDVSSYIDRNGLPISHICGYYDGVMSSGAKKYIKDATSAGAKQFDYHRLTPILQF